MKKFFSSIALGLSLLMSLVEVDYAHAETSTEKTSKTFKITANLKGTVKYQKGGTQQNVPAILTFGEARGTNSLTITDFAKNPSVAIDDLRKMTNNTGGYTLTTDKGEPMRYADAVAKKIPGVKEGGGYAIVQGLRIHVWCDTLGADGKTPAKFVSWIGVDNLKEIIIVNPPKNATGGSEPCVKVIYG